MIKAAASDLVPPPFNVIRALVLVIYRLFGGVGSCLRSICESVFGMHKQLVEDTDHERWSKEQQVAEFIVRACSREVKLIPDTGTG